MAFSAIAAGAVLALLTVTGGTAPAGAGSPASAATVDTGRLQGLRYHLVAPGDTLKKVSTTYGISVEQIRSANGTTVDALATANQISSPN